MSARMSRRYSAADEIEMDLVPVSQEVSATVKVRFGAEPAGLPLKNKEERAEEGATVFPRPRCRSCWSPVARTGLAADSVRCGQPDL